MIEPQQTPTWYAAVVEFQQKHHKLDVSSHNAFSILMSLVYADIYSITGHEPDQHPKIKAQLLSSFKIPDQEIEIDRSNDVIFREIIFELRIKNTTVEAALAMLQAWYESTIS